MNVEISNEFQILLGLQTAMRMKKLLNSALKEFEQIDKEFEKGEKDIESLLMKHNREHQTMIKYNE